MERKLKRKIILMLLVYFRVGGLDLGFIYEGFEIIWANDFDKYAVQTYKRKY